jgi:hypothetical protein
VGGINPTIPAAVEKWEIEEFFEFSKVTNVFCSPFT